MNSTLTREQPNHDALKELKPLPIWFFGFEGVMSAAYDLCHAWSDAWMIIVGLVVVNVIVGLTILGKRIKLLRAMLKNGRTRKIAFGLVALRVGAHVLLGVVGVEATTTTAHLAFSVLMVGVTVTLLWFDQRVTFRALGLAA